MSYIGNQPPDIGAYDVESFNGGGTSFTLKRAATVSSVLLFIDGVRQTPTDAYTVSGVTLTTTATTPSGTDNVGTATLGTDLTVEISADGGSTWTAMTLGSEGSTGTHKIATAHDVTITSTITSPWNMAYRLKTFNQSVSKITRIQAVSLGWS